MRCTPLGLNQLLQEFHVDHLIEIMCSSHRQEELIPINVRVHREGKDAVNPKRKSIKSGVNWMKLTPGFTVFPHRPGLSKTELGKDLQNPVSCFAHAIHHHLTVDKPGIYSHENSKKWRNLVPMCYHKFLGSKHKGVQYLSRENGFLSLSMHTTEDL